MEKFRPQVQQPPQELPNEASYSEYWTRPYNEEWVEQKEQNHQDNVNLLHGVYWHGTYFHNGQGMPSKRQG